MTEERADAGTPGLIDPDDDIYAAIDRMNAARPKTILHTYNPEHHAVFDTRTHVAVPVADIEAGITLLDECQDMTFERWFRSLLPTESEASR